MVSGTVLVVQLKLGLLLAKVAVLPILEVVDCVVGLTRASKVTVPVVPGITLLRFQMIVLVIALKLQVIPLEFGAHEFAWYSRLLSNWSVIVAVLKVAVPVFAYGIVYVTTSSLAVPVGLLCDLVSVPFGWATGSGSVLEVRV